MIDKHMPLKQPSCKQQNLLKNHDYQRYFKTYLKNLPSFGHCS